MSVGKYSDRVFHSQRSALLLSMTMLSACVGTLNFNSGLAAEKEPTQMTEQNVCSLNALQQSRCIIDAIMNDVVQTYRFPFGGGISGIVQESTWVYTVTLPQDERADLITYTVEIDAHGKVEIVDRRESTRSY